MEEKINEILNPLVNTYTLNDEREEVIKQLLELVEAERQKVIEIYNRNLSGNITLETSYGMKRIIDELASTKK